MLDVGDRLSRNSKVGLGFEVSWEVEPLADYTFYTNKIRSS